MPWKFAIASTARGLVLAGFSLLMIATNSKVLGADGSSLPTHALRGIDGRRIDLTATEHGALAIIFYSTECPISNSYSPTLANLADTFQGKPVKWLGVCVDPDLSDSEVAAHARDFGLKFPVVHDRHGSLARKLGAKFTPESFVIDDAGKIRYHGRIDDQFVARRKRNANPSESELKVAIVAVLGGKEVLATSRLWDVRYPRSPRQRQSDLLQGRRTHPSEKLPGVPQAGTGRTVLPRDFRSSEKACLRHRSRGREPVDAPMESSAHVGLKFKDARTLSDDEIATLVAWSEADAPEGSNADLPPPPKFRDDWQLGTPDMVIDIGADFAVPAGGDDVYRCFVVPTHLDKDQYVAAVEYRPGNRSVVHHMLAYVDISGKARERDQAEPGPGYTCFGGPGDPIHGGLGGWAPGNLPYFLPDGIGRSLPKQSDVIVQVHYHPRASPKPIAARSDSISPRSP